MPDWDGTGDDGGQDAALAVGDGAGDGVYAPLDGSINLTPPAGGVSGGFDGSAITFHPLTDPALDQHYANLAQQYDPDVMPGALGAFQQLPPDGISDRWRYTPPDIPGGQ